MAETLQPSQPGGAAMIPQEHLQNVIRERARLKVASFLSQATPLLDAYLAEMEKTDAPYPDFLWYNPETKTASFPEREEFSKILPCFAKTSQHRGDLPQGYGSEAWMPVKMADGALRPFFSALQLAPNHLNQMLGGPTPLAATLAGSVLGTGLGYGAGWLGEKLMGESVLRPGRLRRTGAVLGGLLGGVPGAYLGTVGMRANSEEGKNPWRAWIEPERIFEIG